MNSSPAEIYQVRHRGYLPLLLSVRDGTGSVCKTAREPDCASWSAHSMNGRIQPVSFKTPKATNDASNFILESVHSGTACL